MKIEIRKIITNCADIEIKDIKEIDNLYDEGVIDELCSDHIQNIQYEYYLNGKKIKQTEC